MRQPVRIEIKIDRKVNVARHMGLGWIEAQGTGNFTWINKIRARGRCRLDAVVQLDICQYRSVKAYASGESAIKIGICEITS